LRLLTRLLFPARDAVEDPLLWGVGCLFVDLFGYRIAGLASVLSRFPRFFARYGNDRRNKRVGNQFAVNSFVHKWHEFLLFACENSVDVRLIISGHFGLQSSDGFELGLRA
jgi:hypothetical protein